MDFIEIEGFKSIKSAKVPLSPINILIGANGSGKSNFIQFFEFLNQLYDRKLSEYVALRGAEKILHKGSKITNKINAHISFSQGTNRYALSLVKNDTNDAFIFKNETLWHDENSWNIAHYEKESRLKTTHVYRTSHIRDYLNGLKKYHFHDTGSNSPFNQMSHIDNDTSFLYEKGENLAAFLYSIRLEHPITYNLIVKIIQSIAPFFADFYLQPNVKGFIRLQWQSKYSTAPFGVTDLSDGTIRFMALVMLFMQPDPPKSIIIDEPELGLHPHAITKLAGMIQSVANKGTQVIVATQSADLVNHFEPNDIITVDQKEGETQFNRLAKEPLSLWLEDYMIGNLWQKNVISGGQP
jgi:predicted ATPase